MLTTASVVSEQVNHVYAPLANQVIRHILQEIGMLEFFDNRIYVNSMLHNPSKSYDQKLNAILVEDKVQCTFDIKHSSLGLTWETTNVEQHMDGQLHRRDRWNKLPILLDKAHGISLYDTVLPFNLPMNCVISLRDYVRAHELIDRFHLKFNKGELVSIANLSYDFPLPFDIVKTLWALASTIGVSKKCFPHWLEQYSNGAIKRIVTKGLTNQRVEWVVKREVFQTLVKIDYDLNQDPEKEGLQQSETMGLNFSMILHASRPSVLYVDYPIVVNNVLVPEEIVHVDTSYQHELYKILQHPNLYLNGAYEEQKMLVNQPARNPWYDDWNVPNSHDLHASLNSTPFFIGVFTLDEPSCDDCPCKKDPYGNPYEHQACLHHSWLEERTPYYHHDCNDCPYHKRTPYEEECPCYCKKKATTDINIVEDLDMYKLSDKVKLFYRVKKEKALNVESVYNISVYKDSMRLSNDDIEFDGVTLKVSNKYGPNHIYRVVFSYTPMRSMDVANAETQGYNPYADEYVFIPSVISFDDANAYVYAKTLSKSASTVDDPHIRFQQGSRSSNNVDTTGIIPASEMLGYIQKAIEINKESGSERLVILLREELFEEKGESATRTTVDAIADTISASFTKYTEESSAVLNLLSKFNVCLPDVVKKSAELLLNEEDPTSAEGLRGKLTEYIQNTYESFDSDISSTVADFVASKYEKYSDMETAADELVDAYSVGKNSYFVSTNSERFSSGVFLVMDCLIATDKK